MKISYNWLKDYIDINLSDNELSTILTDIGLEVSKIEHHNNDTIFEIDLTPNRIDAASHFGVARDVAAFLNQEFFNVDFMSLDITNLQIDNTNDFIDVEVQSDKCIRYSGLIISGVSIAESPSWLQNRLISIGINPINNVIDITNFILHDIGQPINVYDRNKITDKIIVKSAEQNLIATVDNVNLTNDDLLVCDIEKVLHVSGIMGNVDSSITNETTAVFIESATYDSVSIRKTAKRLGISTDASYRFERGTDPNITVTALKHVALLIKELAGGIISSNIIDVYPKRINPTEINVTYSNIYRLIGKNISKNRIKRILNNLEIQIKSKSENEFIAVVPTYRVDVKREADIIEEILRIYGYNNIEIPDSVKSTIVYSKKPDDNKLKNKIAKLLVSRGFYETMNNSLTKSSYYDNLKSYSFDNLVVLSNPLSNDLNAMRQTLLFGALENVKHNHNHRNINLKLFEFGSCYRATNKNKHDENNYQEENHLSLLITNDNSSIKTFYDLKNHIDIIFESLGITDIHQMPSSNDVLYKKLQYTVSNKVLVDFGFVNKQLLKQFDIKVDVFYAEIYWNALLDLIHTNVTYKEISKYPEVKRDFTLVINKNVTFEQIREVIKNNNEKILKDFYLVDTYEGDKIPANKKSYTVRFVFQDNTKTLNDKYVDTIMSNFIHKFKKSFNITF
jgi:phenylalanyl-tRNA synthetase beta chain